MRGKCYLTLVKKKKTINICLIKYTESRISGIKGDTFSTNLQIIIKAVVISNVATNGIKLVTKKQNST